MRAVMALAGRVLAASRGRNSRRGRPEAVVRDQAVIDAYSARRALCDAARGSLSDVVTRRAGARASRSTSRQANRAIVGANAPAKTRYPLTIAGMHSQSAAHLCSEHRHCGLASHRVCDLGRRPVAEGRQAFPRSRWPRIWPWGRCCRAHGRAARNNPSGLCAVPDPRRVARATGGRHISRRRAADAGDWPLPEGRARAVMFDETVVGSRPPGAGAPSHHSRSQSRRAHVRAG